MSYIKAHHLFSVTILDLNNQTVIFNADPGPEFSWTIKALLILGFTPRNGHFRIIVRTPTGQPNIIVIPQKKTATFESLIRFLSAKTFSERSSYDRKKLYRAIIKKIKELQAMLPSSTYRIDAD